MTSLDLGFNGLKSLGDNPGKGLGEALEALRPLSCSLKILLLSQNALTGKGQLSLSDFAPLSVNL